MSVFEFLLILVSIIAGLGIAELLGGVVRILREQTRPGTLHSVWILVVFLQLIQHLWAKWNLESKSDWTFSEFILFLLPSIVLFLVAALLFPAPEQQEDLDAYLLRRRRPIFGMLAALMFIFSVEAWVLFDDAPGGSQDIVRLIQFINLSVLMLTERRWVHGFIALLTFSIMLSFAFQFTPWVG